MHTALEVYEATLKKLNAINAVLKSCLAMQDFQRANETLEQFRSYSLCPYCVNYRKTMDKGWEGVCGKCPLHRYGEDAIGQKISYNGCYRIGNYRSMAKNAFWFAHDPSTSTLEVAIKSIDLVLKNFGMEKEVLTQ